MVPDGTASQIPFLQANNNAFTSLAPSGLSHDTDHRQEISLPGLITFFFLQSDFRSIMTFLIFTRILAEVTLTSISRMRDQDSKRGNDFPESGQSQRWKLRLSGSQFHA